MSMIWILCYVSINRSYATTTAGVRSIWDAGNNLFRQKLDQYPELQSKITYGLLSSIEAVR